jgi:hypothetical protein
MMDSWNYERFFVDYMSIFGEFKKQTLRGLRREFFDVIRTGPCEDLLTWTSFCGALTVTLATMDIVAKSKQRPREVHCSFLKMDISVFQQGRHPQVGARVVGPPGRRLPRGAPKWPSKKKRKMI